jgi:hypothetical protein
MYLWKCWRNTRLSAGLYGFVIAFTIWSLMRHGFTYLSFGSEGGASVHNVWAASIFLEIFGGVLAFVAWVMGGVGIGRDIGEGSGAFMITRPRPRRYFLWWDIGFGLGLLILLGSMTMVLFEIGVHFNVLRFGGGAAWANGNVHHPVGGVPAIAILLLLLSGIVFAGLIYSITYLCTLIAERTSVGLMLSGGALAGYFWLYAKDVVPNLRVNPYPNPLADNPAPHVWLELGGRVIAIVVLLLAAQFVLERREIRA